MMCKSTKKKVLVGVLLFLIGILNVANVKSTTQEETIETIADEDSFVSMYLGANKNFGGREVIYVGNYINTWSEGYLHFSFTDKPDDWVKAEISIYAYAVSETFEASISLIEDDWDEMAITWENKPVHGEIIMSFTVAEVGWYTIDVTNFIEGRDDISICVNASDDSQNGWIQLSSTTNEDISTYPILIWTYPVEGVDSGIIYGFDLPIFILTILSIGMMLVFFRKRKTKVL